MRTAPPPTSAMLCSKFDPEMLVCNEQLNEEEHCNEIAPPDSVTTFDEKFEFTTDVSMKFSSTRQKYMNSATIPPSQGVRWKLEFQR